MREIIVALSLLAVVGCGSSGPALEPVTGTIKFSDGSVPQGEVIDIMFEPAESGPQTKLAKGTIKPDGTFVLGTLIPGDGAFAGKYKVYVDAFKTYLGREPLAHAKFMSAKTTPLEVEVKKGQKNEFNDLKIEKP